MAKVLLIEDDPNILQLVSELLRSEHHEVECSQSAVEAGNMLRVYSYDLIMLDLSLPDGSGIDVCREYRRRGGCSPVFMLTGKSKDSEIELGLDSGADDYLSKPFPHNVLLARVRALLRRGSADTDSSLRHGDLILDVKARTVINHGAEVRLSPREFALLEFLMRHPNRVFSAEALLNRVWPSDVTVDDNTVRVHIKALRKKLSNSDENSCIQTVHGVGYKLRGA